MEREKPMEAQSPMTAAAFLWSLGAGHGPLHVVDVGANPIEGDAPYKALLQAGYARVTGFEPQAAALAELNARKSQAETYHPQALGAGGAAQLQLYKHSGFTSLFRIRPAIARLLGFQGGTRPAGTLAICTERLDDLEAVAPIDFLKIDVQGSELAIISNGRKKLAEAVLIQTEVRFLPLYEGEPGFGDLDRELRAQGFLFHDFAFLKRQPLRSRSVKALRPRTYRQVIDGDAFFIRDLTRVATLTEAQLWRLALLAETVVGSPNLALFCLDALVDRGCISDGEVQAYVRLLPENQRREI